MGNLEPVYDPFPITSEILSLTYDLFPILNKLASPEAVTQTCVSRLCETEPGEKVVIFTVNHRGTLRSRELNR